MVSVPLTMGQDYTMGKYSLFTTWYWGKWISTCRETDPHLQCTKISKWIRDINVRPIAVKLPKEMVGGKLTWNCLIWAVICLDITQKVQATKVE